MHISSPLRRRLPLPAVCTLAALVWTLVGGTPAVRAQEPVQEKTEEDAEPQAAPLKLPVVVGPTDPNQDDLTDSMPGDPWGDAQGLSVISLRALFQMRYTTTFAADSDSSRASYVVREENLAQQGDGWAVNRLFLRLSSDPVKYVGFKSVLDFSELLDGDPEDVVKQAYAVLRPVPERFEIAVGLFKLPFSTLELDASARFEFADMGMANQLVGDLGYAGRDLGMQVMVAPLRKPKRLRLSVGAFRGHMHDEHDLPSGILAGRVEVKPIKSLRFGADVVDHLRAVTYDRPFNTSSKDELPNPPDPLYPAQKRWGAGRAYSVDARFKKKGFMLRGEFLYGDRVDMDERYKARTFWASWGIAAYRIEAGKVTLIPAVRAEWLDSDREHGKGMYRTLSLGLTTLFLERVRVLLDVSRVDVEEHTAVLNQPKPLPESPYLALDTTRVIAQLQLEL
jgi:hypothetical protein